MGTGDLYSTVEDLFKFHLAISNHRLLNKQLTDEMLSENIRPARYGYGWFNQKFRYTPTDSNRCQQQFRQDVNNLALVHIFNFSNNIGLQLSADVFQIPHLHKHFNVSGKARKI